MMAGEYLKGAPQAESSGDGPWQVIALPQPARRWGKGEVKVRARQGEDGVKAGVAPERGVGCHFLSFCSLILRS